MLSRRLALLPVVLLACGSDDAATNPATPGGGTSSGGTSSSGGTTPGGDGGTTPPENFPDAKGDACRGTAVSDEALVAPGLCARLIARGSSVSGIRQIMFASNGDLFAQTSGGAILLLRDENNDGVYSKEEVHAWAETDGNGNNAHVDEAGGYVYAGSSDGVHRFKYDATTLKGGAAEKVVVGQPGGGHSKHTAHVYDGFLYVVSGSSGNQSHEGDNPIGEYDTNRSLIRRFDLSKFTGTAFNWKDGEVFTVGLRNANGFTRNETTKKIYAVVNGLDDVRFKGVDVHNDNPGEQIAEIAKDKKYGYPYCFTAQAIDNGGTIVEPGTQLFHQNFGANPHDEAWCLANSMKPTTFVQAHSAPLDLAFFDRQPKGNLPDKYRGGAFVAMHGSWDRAPGTHVGRMVVWVPFHPDGTSPTPTTKKEGDKLVTTFPYEVIFGPKDDSIRRPNDGQWTWNDGQGASDSPRPAGVAISPIDGSLYFASDNNGTLYRVGVKH